MPTTDTNVSQVIVNKLTKAQYDSATKSATEFYAVTDVDGESYSTTEQKTDGTWIDGKPIYKKTIDFGYLPNDAVKSVAHNIANISQVIKIEGTAMSGTTAIPLPIPASDSSASGYCQIAVSSTNIVVDNGNDRTSWYAYMTVYYTKTTD